MQTWLVGLAALIILGGGAYVVTMSSSSEGDVMKEDGDAMMEKEGGAMIQKEEGTMMDKDEGAMMKKDESAVMDKGDTATMSHGGTYEAYSPEKIAWAQHGKVVLFFRASWCPTCRTLDSNIKSNLSSIPKDVTILDVNYDTETALKQKYGVTYQHTLVQVDAEGAQIAKWNGGSTLASLLGNVK